MKKILNINNFAKAGLNTDAMPWDLPGDYLTDLSNVRIASGKLSPFGGYANWKTMPLGFQPGYLAPAGSTSNSNWILCALQSVMSYDGATFSDITGDAISVVSEHDWHSCNLGEVLVVHNPSVYPLYWPTPDGGVPLVNLPWDGTQTWEDAGQQAKIIRSHRQYLFALNITNGGDHVPDGVRWSSPADNGGVPETWDHLDITNFAGLTSLSGDGGAIIDGLTLRDSFVVYRERGVSIFDFVGGQYVWQIRHLTSSVGLLSRDCIVEVKGKHFLIGDGDILVNDGVSVTSLLHNRIRKRFMSTLNVESFHKSYVVKNSALNEVWFCVPEVGHELPNVAYVYNWSDDTWSIRYIPECTHANYGSESTPSLKWEDYTGSWDSASSPWGARQITPMDDTIIGCTSPKGVGESGKLLLLDVTETSNIYSYDTIIERVGFALEGLNNTTTITRVYPHANGSGALYIEVGSQEYPGSPINWKDAVLFRPGVDRKVDIRSTGELHCFRFSSSSDSGYWELSGVDIEYTLAGTR